MAQDRTHRGRVDFGDGILLENMDEPSTEAHGGQAFASGADGNFFFKTKSGVLHQITPVLGGGGGGATTSGVSIANQSSIIGLFDVVNFSGAGVTAIKDGTVAQVIIPEATSGIKVFGQDSLVGLFDQINFSGTGIAVAKDGDIADVVVNAAAGSSVKVIEKTFTRAELNALGAVTVGDINFGTSLPVNAQVLNFRAKNGGTVFTNSGGTVTGLQVGLGAGTGNIYTSQVSGLHQADRRATGAPNFSGVSDTTYPYDTLHTPSARFVVSGSGVTLGNLTDGDDGIVIEIFYVDKP